jgi:hypothetical protein
MLGRQSEGMKYRSVALVAASCLYQRRQLRLDCRNTPFVRDPLVERQLAVTLNLQYWRSQDGDAYEAPKREIAIDKTPSKMPLSVRIVKRTGIQRINVGSHTLNCVPQRVRVKGKPEKP